MSDYIKLYRSMLEWEWYSDINTSRLFIHLLLKANWKEGKFQGETIPRGSLVSSLQKLSEESGLSLKSVRTALNHLKVTGEVASRSTPKFTVFTINNYDLYQTSDKQSDKQATSDRQTSDKQSTTIEEKKEGKKERNNIYTCAFEEFWQAYPRKKDKGNAFKKFNARLKSGFSEVQLTQAAKEYALECQKNQTAQQYIKHPSTFLSDTLPFLDYLEQQEVKTAPKEPEEEEELAGDDW